MTDKNNVQSIQRPCHSSAFTIYPNLSKRLNPIRLSRSSDRATPSTVLYPGMSGSLTRQAPALPPRASSVRFSTT